MARDTKHKEIDGIAISVTQWPARKAFKYKRKLGKIFAPAIGELGAAINPDDIKKLKKGKPKKDDVSFLEKDFDFSKVGNAFTMLFDSITEDEIDTIFVWMFSGVRIKDKELTLDEIDVTFAGEMMTIYKVFGFVLEVNFGSFLGKSGIGKLLSRIQV